MKKNSKKLISLLFIFLMSSYCLFGKVTINLKYTDVDGVGFKAPRNSWMQEVAQEATELVGGIIKQNAHINIEIRSNFKINCAVSNPKFWHIESENTNQKAILEAHHKIISENTINDGKIHGQIEFNTNYFSKVYKNFLRRTIIHELTHLLGFIPWKMDHKNYPSYNDYDKLLHDGNNNYFLIGGSKLIINPEFDFSTGLYACGPNIQSLNDGKSVTIYCPKKYECGSSYAHLDPNTHPLSIMNPCGNLQDYPLWNKCELGIMQDLGYKIDWKQYNLMLCKLTSKKNVSMQNQLSSQIDLEKEAKEFQVTDNEEDPGYQMIDNFFDSIVNYFSKK